MQRINMNAGIKKKLKFSGIGFIILMIPIGFFVKIAIAIDMHNTAMHKVKVEGCDDNASTEEAIMKIDKAIWLYRRNYLFYVSKAKLLCRLKKYHEAIATLNKIEKFKDDYAQGYELKGFIYDKLQLTVRKK
jgi:tetratricopeptide (TPR) repeat protein